MIFAGNQQRIFDRLIINNCIIIALLLVDCDLWIFLCESLSAFTKRTCKTITVIDVTVWVMKTIQMSNLMTSEVFKGSTNGKHIVVGRITKLNLQFT